MQGDQVGFERSFRQHLDGEQRRAVLESLRRRINPDSTLGEVLDAAQALGWGDKLGDLSLADLADALLAPDEGEDDADATEAEASAELEDDADVADIEDVAEEETIEVEIERPAPASRRKGKAKRSTKKKASKAASKKPAGKQAASKKAASKKAASKKASKAASKKPSKASSKKAAKKTSSKKASKSASRRKGRRTVSAVDIDERMSLEQAAEFFVPYVEEIGEATMQALEEATGVARRKLRFHIGQLVRHEYLERHGMGRGTYYTVC